MEDANTALPNLSTARPRRTTKPLVEPTTYPAYPNTYPTTPIWTTIGGTSMPAVTWSDNSNQATYASVSSILNKTE